MNLETALADVIAGEAAESAAIAILEATPASLAAVSQLAISAAQSLTASPIGAAIGAVLVSALLVHIITSVSEEIGCNIPELRRIALIHISSPTYRARPVVQVNGAGD